MAKLFITFCLIVAGLLYAGLQVPTGHATGTANLQAQAQLASVR